MRSAPVFLSALFLAAVPALSRPLGTPRSLTPAEKSVVEAAASSGLLDPDAAKFKWFKYNGSDHYCGLLNGKNSYGGYIGYRHYSVDVKRDGSGNIVAADKLSVVDASTSYADTMRIICETSAKADTEDKAPIVPDP